MSTATPDQAQDKLHGDFVLLRAGTLRLLLPQGEVGAAEYLEARPQPAGEPGLLQVPGDPEQRAFAALSPQMTLLAECPKERFVVATFSGDEARIGWCWDELRVLIGVDLLPQPLPGVLLTPETPVQQYVEQGGEIAYLCSADRIAGFALSAGATP